MVALCRSALVHGSAGSTWSRGGVAVAGDALVRCGWRCPAGRLFLNAALNGLTLASLYLSVASGFTLIFGLMRVVNMAHGSLYLLGAYVGYEVQAATESWAPAALTGAGSAAALGALLLALLLGWMQRQDLRQAPAWSAKRSLPTRANEGSHRRYLGVGTSLQAELPEGEPEGENEA